MLSFFTCRFMEQTRYFSIGFFKNKKLFSNTKHHQITPNNFSITNQHFQITPGFSNNVFSQDSGIYSTFENFPKRLLEFLQYLHSNLPLKIIFVSIGFEILCIVRTATDLFNTVTRVNLLLICMKSKVINIPVSFHY